MSAALVSMAVGLEHSLLHGRTFVAVDPHCEIVRLCVNWWKSVSDLPLVCYRRLFVQMKKCSEDDNSTDERNTWKTVKEGGCQHPWRSVLAIRRSPSVLVFLDRLLLKLRQAYRFEEEKGIPTAREAVVVADRPPNYCYSVQNPGEATCSFLWFRRNGYWWFSGAASRAMMPGG